MLLLAGCGGATRVDSPAPLLKQNAGSAPARRALAHAVTAPIPARNLFRLANALKLRPPRTIPKVVRTTAPRDKVGQSDTFRVLAENNNRYFTVRATVRALTPHLVVYVENGTSIDLVALRRSAQRFERETYPTNRRYFGSEWTPGVDGDPRIVTLIADLKSSSAIGYFSAEDEYPRLVNPYSNQREIVYLNSAQTLPGERLFDDTLVHEFQHMIHWHMHPRDNGWLNEGMSTLAEALNGFTPNDYRDSFLALPQTQLNSWSVSGPTSLSHYGAAYLYLAYLYDKYGARLIRDLVRLRRYTDFQLVDAALKREGIAATADGLFVRWVVANYLRDPSVAGGIYDYPALVRRVSTPAARTVPFRASGTLSPYAAQYETIDNLAGAPPFDLRFNAPGAVPLVGTSGAPFWWSNRGDMSDTSLQRTVDLRKVRRATLRFDAWYDIEKSYDYAYVELSRDGGTTWSTLKTTDTTTTNPYGANYGNGYTGGSGGWRRETADLSPYAGRVVSIRFEYITDDVYTGQGMAVRNIAVPQIGYRDTFAGWRRNGFVPVLTNSLAARWQVRLIEYTATGVRVRSLPLRQGGSDRVPTATGSLRIDPAKLGLQKIVAVVFYGAPKTTVQIPWSLSAANG